MASSTLLSPEQGDAVAALGGHLLALAQEVLGADGQGGLHHRDHHHARVVRPLPHSGRQQVRDGAGVLDAQDAEAVVVLDDEG
jgi:hypothetical protein